MVETQSYTESNEEVSLVDSRPRSASMFPGIKPRNARIVSNVSTGEYVTALQQGSSNTLVPFTQVSIRCRPLSKKEVDAGHKSVVKVLSANLLLLLDTNTETAPEEAFRVNRSKEKQFAFDIVLDTPAAQEEVFQKTTAYLIEGVLNGYNATVFAYGATGAGKTFTYMLPSMLGTLERPGVMPNSLSAMFDQIQELARDREYQVKICYLEIYNEMIRDLISPSSDVLEIREDPVKGVQVAGLTEILASTPEEVIKVMHLGNRQRTTEPTAANETSSRSHAVLQITVEYKDRAVGIEADICVGKLSMIDLAGSERASVTNNRGMRLIEGANINRSLLALGNCINALCEANEKGVKIHVRYRDSKLTRLLKDSLGGNCRTVMIACISPSAGNYEDTLNTLKYANRAKNIKTNIQRNVFNVSYHIMKYAEIISSLKAEVQELRGLVSTKAKIMPATSMPAQPGIEKYLIDLNSHFAEEAKIRKKLQEAEQISGQIGFTLFDRKRDLNSVKRSQGEESPQAQRKSSEIDNLLRMINANHKLMDGERTKLVELEERRELFPKQWKKAGLKDAQLAQLQASLAQLVAAMVNSDLALKSQHTEVVLKQQTQYINTLKDQVMLRDTVITEQTSVLLRHNIDPSPNVGRLMTLNEIEVSSKIAFSKANGPVKVKPSGNASMSMEQLLPPIGQTKIPTVKQAPRPYGGSVPPRKAINVQLSPIRRDNRMAVIRGSRSGSSSPDNLAAISMTDKSASPVASKSKGTVAEKIAASPYVKINPVKPTSHNKGDISPATRGRSELRRNP